MRKSDRRKRHRAKQTIHEQKSPPHPKPFRGVDNTRDLDLILGRTKLFQDVLGVSQEELSQLYEQAMGFLQTNRIDEAVLAFSFLTKMNSYAADFWIGLGVAQLINQEYQKAFEAFLMAITMDPSRYDCYAYAIECCNEMKNYAQAEAILREAVSYAKRHHSRAESALILEESSRLQSEIDARKGV